VRLCLRSKTGFIAASLFLCGLLLYVWKIHDFLALNSPINGEILVVEGWFPDVPGMADAANALLHHNYQRVVCVAVDDPEDAASAHTSNAQRASKRLISLGVNPLLIHVIALKSSEHDRTFHCALAVKSWLEKEHPKVRSIDVFTVGIHARKSLLLYKKAMPEGFSVGIIAAKDSRDFASNWWLSPRGIYLVLRNTVGYLYALAHPN
jgi:hypothetical protein